MLLLLPLIIDTTYSGGSLATLWIGGSVSPSQVLLGKSTLVDQALDHSYRPVRCAGNGKCSLDSVREVWTVCMVSLVYWCVVDDDRRASV
jgi:hypothetical protein